MISTELIMSAVSYSALTVGITYTFSIFIKAMMKVTVPSLQVYLSGFGLSTFIFLSLL